MHLPVRHPAVKTVRVRVRVISFARHRTLLVRKPCLKRVLKKSAADFFIMPFKWPCRVGWLAFGTTSVCYRVMAISDMLLSFVQIDGAAACSFCAVEPRNCFRACISLESGPSRGIALATACVCRFSCHGCCLMPS